MIELVDGFILITHLVFLLTWEHHGKLLSFSFLFAKTCGYLLSTLIKISFKIVLKASWGLQRESLGTFDQQTGATTLPY